MYGTNNHVLDSKGRLSIPARFREELGNVIFVTIGVDTSLQEPGEEITEENTRRCLTAYSPEGWGRFMEKINGLAEMKKKLMRPFYANAARCEVDAQGRIQLTPELREYAGLAKDVTIVGSVTTLEIWNSDTFGEIGRVQLSGAYIAQQLTELGI